MLCPRCLHPAPKRVDVRPGIALERFTCAECGCCTLREELIADKRFNILRGGPMPSAASPPVGTVLLETLRPTGTLGDTTDVGYEENSAFDGLFSVPLAGPIAVSNLSATPSAIAYLKFFARLTWYTSGIGPDPASCRVRWCVSGGTFAAGSDELIPESVSLYTEIVTGEQATDPDFAPWTETSINGLELEAQYFANSNGSGEETFGRVTELWVEVWGTP